MAKQTLKQAIHLVKIGKIRTSLHGCPVGGWPETEQACRQISEQLPLRSERSYTVDDLVAALYTIEGESAESSGRYRYRWPGPYRDE